MSMELNCMLTQLTQFPVQADSGQRYLQERYSQTGTMRNPVLDLTPTGLPKDTVSSLRPVFFSTINISFFCALPICKPTCIIFHIQKWILAFISPSRYSHISLLLLIAKSSKELIIIAFIFSIPICSWIHSDKTCISTAPLKQYLSRSPVSAPHCQNPGIIVNLHPPTSQKLFTSFLYEIFSSCGWYYALLVLILHQRLLLFHLCCWWLPSTLTLEGWHAPGPSLKQISLSSLYFPLEWSHSVWWLQILPNAEDLKRISMSLVLTSLSSIQACPVSSLTPPLGYLTASQLSAQ